jgi:hypothetical protein
VVFVPTVIDTEPPYVPWKDGAVILNTYTPGDRSAETVLGDVYF